MKYIKKPKYFQVDFKGYYEMRGYACMRISKESLERGVLPLIELPKILE